MEFLGTVWPADGKLVWVDGLGDKGSYCFGDRSSDNPSCDRSACDGSDFFRLVLGVV